jgi:hypothetical protein
LLLEEEAQVALKSHTAAVVGMAVQVALAVF